MAQLLFSNDHLECLFDDRGGDLLLITFNELFTEADGRTYWGQRAMAALGVSCLGMVSKSRNWFPEAGLTPHLEQLRPILNRFQRRVSYGFSQGGYGAIRHSAALGTTETLAFSPQYSIEPAKVSKFELRFQQRYNPALHADMAIRSEHVGGRVLVFRDPHNREDFGHSALIAAASTRVSEIALHFVGHTSVSVASSSTLLANLLAMAAASELDVRGLFRILRTAKRTKPEYYIILGRACLNRHHLAWATAACTIAEKLTPGHEYAAKLRADIAVTQANRMELV